MNFEYLCIRVIEEHSFFFFGFFQGSNGGMAKSCLFFFPLYFHSLVGVWVRVHDFCESYLSYSFLK
jgi:hypothetical protein